MEPLSPHTPPLCCHCQLHCSQPGNNCYNCMCVCVLYFCHTTGSSHWCLLAFVARCYLQRVSYEHNDTHACTQHLSHTLWPSHTCACISHLVTHTLTHTNTLKYARTHLKNYSPCTPPTHKTSNMTEKFRTHTNTLSHTHTVLFKPQINVTGMHNSLFSCGIHLSFSSLLTVLLHFIVTLT